MGSVKYSKLRPNAQGPIRAHQFDAGSDLVATAPPEHVDGKLETHSDRASGEWLSSRIPPGAVVLFKLGISIGVPKGYEATIRSRSGLGAKHGFCVRQGIGTIDCGYSGELAVYMVNNSNEILEIKNGDRIAQLVVSPISLPDWEEATLTTSSSRGTGGFGSTDKT